MEPVKDYNDYNVNDFITDPYFIEWVKSPNKDNDAFWQQWIAAHPHKQQQTEEARAFILSLQFKEQKPSAAAIEAALERNLAMIAALEQEQRPVARPGKIRKIWRWTAAAAVAGALLVAARQLFVKQQPQIVEYVGHTDGVRKVLLPDSSEVILNANASISFNEHWERGDDREVWLKGEAFFDIRPMAAHPFIVHSANMAIDVLGTSFNVKEGNAFTNVTLNTGKIKVRFRDLPEDKQLYLNPGDFVQYSAKDNKITKKRVNADLYAGWKEEGRQLKDVTLKEIAIYIEDIYGYHVQISSSKLAAEKLSGGLRVKDEKLLLETLAFALDLRIEKKADTLLIQPK